VAFNLDTREWVRYKVGSRVRVRTGYWPNARYPLLSGEVVKIEPKGTEGGCLELYTIRLDKPSYRNFCDRKVRPGKNPMIWRTDSSMCAEIPVLEDLSEV
jgi:hypothetical protein